MIERGEGVYLFDVDGNRYLDGTSSLWCNVHGHHHPDLDRAAREQFDKVAHSTMLGLSHPGATELAARLVEIAPAGLPRVFYSDSGSTAAEIALKMAFQYHQQRGDTARTRFIRMREAYHGDTIGSVSVGGIDLFHATYRPLLFETLAAEPGDAAHMERLLSAHEGEVAAVIMEPLVQGAGGMIVHPDGYLRAVRELCDRHGVLLICDEVATGFGRTGTMFACEREGVSPDFLCLAKGITGGYLPLAATLTTEAVYEGFLGAPAEAQHLLPRPHLHRQPGRLRGGARQPRRLRARADDRALQPKIELLEPAAGRDRRDAGRHRGPLARRDGRHRPRRARPRTAPRPPGDARGPQARRPGPSPLRRRRPDVAALDHRGRAERAARHHRGVDHRRPRLPPRAADRT